MTHAPTVLTADLVRDILRDQHPDLAELPITLGAKGWDNQLWRLGEDLAVRLPWATESADDLLRKEYRWLPELSRRLPLPVPVPTRLGEPSPRFPRPWIVTTWVPGEPADRAPVTDEAAADALAAFLTALHRAAPADAPTGRNRGGGLTEHAEPVAALLADLADRGLITEPEAVGAVWADALAAPAWSGPPLWLHGDLHAANLLTTDGRLSGVIDFGDLSAGDPAWDLAAVWLLPDTAVDRCLAGYAPDPATRRRARGCAVARALGGITVGTDPGPGGKPSWAPPARAALRRLLAVALPDSSRPSAFSRCGFAAAALRAAGLDH